MNDEEKRDTLQEILKQRVIAVDVVREHTDHVFIRTWNGTLKLSARSGGSMDIDFTPSREMLGRRGETRAARH